MHAFKPRILIKLIVVLLAVLTAAAGAYVLFRVNPRQPAPAAVSPGDTGAPSGVDEETAFVHQEASLEALMDIMGMQAFPGRPAAEDFVLESLQGHRVRLSAYRGKVVLLSFWATW
jgi:hypothetical protein